ncbi:hypothetical protein EMIT0194MI4_40161 [Pseudomonas sp. IT-194MI4]
MLPLGCEATPKRFYDCSAAEREQAPSPQAIISYISQGLDRTPTSADDLSRKIHSLARDHHE